MIRPRSWVRNVSTGSKPGKENDLAVKGVTFYLKLSPYSSENLYQSQVNSATALLSRKFKKYRIGNM